MKNFFSNLRCKLSESMRGRYGTDRLNRFLSGVSLVCAALSLIPYLRFFLAFAFLVTAFSTFRTFSRNIPKRRREEEKYLRLSGKIVGRFRLLRCMWKDRKTHRYYVCPSCKAAVRIQKPPKGRTISVKCPKCGTFFDRKT